MRQIQGKYNTAIAYGQYIEEAAINQIKILCDQEFTKRSKIRIMPDVHCGAGCTIGTTMTIEDKVVPNLVGVDIGCGMEIIKIRNRKLDLNKLDKLIYSKIPSGFNIRKKAHDFNCRIDLTALKAAEKVNLKRARLSIGTLGGGNHFIEVNKDSQDNLYLVVHSGSRHLGNEIAKLYQKKATEKLCVNTDMPKTLAYLSKRQSKDYLHDMSIIQEFADINRKAIIEEIINGMELEVVENFTTIHNYIDMKSMILRKGAVSARQGEKILVPLNMKDGSLICVGKGNPDWNYSAPHGAGRIMSRTKARKSLKMEQYKNLMSKIHTTSVSKNTLDECPLAYKPMEAITSTITPTAKIVERIKPVYNFKAPQ
ncbi:RtcB family protein [Proteinivorax hydrogeniformans]|uniref:3'-phosphate/5'-hydroxy nucleic acid ligase n=1 Tax=Proteinivorax hydrogeniformans TaxID=1826727 RepID=A0AAU8HRR0_9FIRM